MKKLLIIALLCLLAASLFAGGAENKNNLSAGYLRNPSKNTETSGADAVFYNPAGTAFMEDGLYIEAANQFLLKEYTNDASDLAVPNVLGSYNALLAADIDLGKYTSDNPVLLFPSAEMVWKKDNYAIFGSFGVAAGGGQLDYDKGTFATDSLFQTFIGDYNPLSGLVPALAGVEITEDDIAHSLEAYSVTFGETIGASYSFKEMVSVSAAVRFLQGKATQKVTLENDPSSDLTTVSTVKGFPVTSKNLVDIEAEATGIGYIFGIHVKPIEKLDVAMQYQTMTKMEYEYTKAKGDAVSLFEVEKGDKYDQDLPAMLGVGVGYQVLTALYMSTSFNYYFNDQADMIYDDSWELALGGEYALNEKIALSAGGMYSKQGYKKGKNVPENPLLDSFTIGLGTGLNFVKNLTIDVGLMKPIYFDTDYESEYGDVTLSKSLTIIGIGATYKIF